MTHYPVTGAKVVKRAIPTSAFQRFKVRPVQELNDFQRVIAIRAAVYMSEQDCPYDEEYDGNDLCASHFLVFDGPIAIGTLRIRWFSEFAKLERITFLSNHRGGQGLLVLLAEAFEVVARKGYRKMVGHIQARLWPLWSRTFDCKLLENRPTFQFSDYDYREIIIFIPRHPTALALDEDPYVLLRPEGDWDRPGVLDQISPSETHHEKAA